MKLKDLLTEHYGESNALRPISGNEQDMNDHHARAIECSHRHRFYRDRSEWVPDDTKGQYAELARAYESAAKTHLSLADHHTFQVKKERQRTVGEMLKKPKAVLGKSGATDADKTKVTK